MIKKQIKRKAVPTSLVKEKSTPKYYFRSKTKFSIVFIDQQYLIIVLVSLEICYTK